MKFIQVSIATLALLGYIEALNIKSYQGMGDQALANANVDAYAEAGRYINAKGEPIILSETKGHARIELTQVKKYKHDE